MRPLSGLFLTHLPWPSPSPVTPSPGVTMSRCWEDLGCQASGVSWRSFWSMSADFSVSNSQGMTHSGQHRLWPTAEHDYYVSLNNQSATQRATLKLLSQISNQWLSSLNYSYDQRRVSYQESSIKDCMFVSAESGCHVTVVTECSPSLTDVPGWRRLVALTGPLSSLRPQLCPL